MTDRSDEKLERQRLAQEAERLIKDDTLLRALANVRQRAIEALIKADATNTADVIRHQSRVSVCDDFMGELKTMIQLQSIENRSRIV